MKRGEEKAMRELVVPRLRALWPDARVVHEFGLRYSTNRLDLAAISPAHLAAVEIKSSADAIGVERRLEAQIRAFLPVVHRLIVALAPKWCVQPSPARVILDHIGRAPGLEVWRVCADTQQVEVIVPEGGFRSRWDQAHSVPWSARLLDVLWSEELREIAAAHGVGGTTHDVLVAGCNELMTGREIVTAVCTALRGRAAFARGSDPPAKANQAVRGQMGLGI